MMNSIIQNMSDSDWLSATAIIISVFALSISLYEILNNKPKLRITLGQAITTGPNFVYVEIINYGRQPTTIDSICFSKKGSKKNIWVPAYEPLSSEKNAYLHPGEKATYFYRFDSIGTFAGKQLVLGEEVSARRVFAKVRDTWSGKTKIAILPNKKIELSVE